MISIFRANKEASQPSRRQIIRRAAPPAMPYTTYIRISRTIFENS
jgi:hypothetical protein